MICATLGSTSMTIRPLHDRIMVQRIDQGEQKVGEIIIPDSAKEKPEHGKVIAAGHGKSKDDGKRVPLDVKTGDSILFGKCSGQEIKLDGDEYLIMREDDVLPCRRSRGGRRTSCWGRSPADSGCADGLMRDVRG